MNFRKIHSSVRRKRPSTIRQGREVEDEHLYQELQDVATITLDRVSDGIGLSIIAAKVIFLSKWDIFFKTKFCFPVFITSITLLDPDTKGMGR